MVRVNITISPVQAERLDRESGKQKVSKSEIIRKALDAYFKGKG